MERLLIPLACFSLTVLAFSCKESSTVTLDYQSLNYDTGRIAIFKWDTTKYQFPGNSDPLPLTQEDLKVVDSLLKDAVDGFNTEISAGLYRSFNGRVPVDSFIIRPEKYKLQYFPFRDVNGERIITIVGFSTNFEGWKKKAYLPKLHYGISMFELNVNLTLKTRDNIRSGSFG